MGAIKYYIQLLHIVNSLFNRRRWQWVSFGTGIMATSNIVASHTSTIFNQFELRKNLKKNFLVFLFQFLRFTTLIRTSNSEDTGF